MVHMKRIVCLLVYIFWIVGLSANTSLALSSPDIRGLWIGSANGAIFGAEGSVNITHQKGDEIYGVVEGSNFFGKARFTINGKIRGNYIFGAKDGHTFHGAIYGDGSIRGVFRAEDGDTYQIFLQRPYYWGWGIPQRNW